MGLEVVRHVRAAILGTAGSGGKRWQGLLARAVVRHEALLEDLIDTHGDAGCRVVEWSGRDTTPCEDTEELPDCQSETAYGAMRDHLESCRHMWSRCPHATNLGNGLNTP